MAQGRGDGVFVAGGNGGIDRGDELVVAGEVEVRQGIGGCVLMSLRHIHITDSSRDAAKPACARTGEAAGASQVVGIGPRSGLEPTPVGQIPFVLSVGAKAAKSKDPSLSGPFDFGPMALRSG